MTKSPSPLDFVADLLDSVADRLEESLKTPVTDTNEAPHGEDPSVENVELLNPFAEAQRVLGKVEAVADELTHDEQKAAALLEVAKAHTEIGKQLLDSFDF